MSKANPAVEAAETIQAANAEGELRKAATEALGDYIPASHFGLTQPEYPAMTTWPVEQS